MLFLLQFPERKSSKTWLLHLGHLGLLSKDMMIYIMQLGQPTTTIDLASPPPPSASSEHNDEDELSVGKDESSIFSFRSSSRLLAASCWLIIFLAFQEDRVRMLRYYSVGSWIRNTIPKLKPGFALENLDEYVTKHVYIYYYYDRRKIKTVDQPNDLCIPSIKEWRWK